MNENLYSKRSGRTSASAKYNPMISPENNPIISPYSVSDKVQNIETEQSGSRNMGDSITKIANYTPSTFSQNSEANGLSKKHQDLISKADNFEKISTQTMRKSSY